MTANQQKKYREFIGKLPVHLRREIEAVKRQLLRLSGTVEENLKNAVDSVNTRNTELARKVIETDHSIDLAEVEVEEECLKILALHQPVAFDLRFIVAILKINSDLERIGDLAVNVAERSIFLSSQPEVEVGFDFPEMAEKARIMLKESLDAFVNLDRDKASAIFEQDDDVDAICSRMYELVKTETVKQPENINAMIHLLSIARHLERIADHAANISKDIIYMIDGEIIRHRTEEYKRHEGSE